MERRQMTAGPSIVRVALVGGPMYDQALRSDSRV